MGARPSKGVFDTAAKKELEARVEALLAERYARVGAMSFLEPGLSVIADADGVHLEDTPNPDALASIELHDLPSVRSFLIIRNTEMAIPRDVLANIATEAARAVSRKLNALV